MVREFDGGNVGHGLLWLVGDSDFREPEFISKWKINYV